MYCSAITAATTRTTRNISRPIVDAVQASTAVVRGSSTGGGADGRRASAGGRAGPSLVGAGTSVDDGRGGGEASRAGRGVDGGGVGSTRTVGSRESFDAGTITVGDSSSSPPNGTGWNPRISVFSSPYRPR